MSRLIALGFGVVAPFLLNAQSSDRTKESASVKAGRASAKAAG